MVRIFILLVLILHRKACHVRESDSRRKESMFIVVFTCEKCLQCHRVLVSATPFGIRSSVGILALTFRPL